MRIAIPELLQAKLQLPAEIDTATTTENDLTAIYDLLARLADEQVDFVSYDDRPAFQIMISEVGIALVTALDTKDFVQDEVPTDLLAVMPKQPVTIPSSSTGPPTTTTTEAAKPKPKNPHANKAKKLRKDFGAQVHDQMHFAPTDTKKNHGVWGTKNTATIKGWVGLALDSIYLNDDYLVASKPGKKPGEFSYLVNMNQVVVGYLSGSSAKGAKPPATHIEVFLQKSGVTVSAFPSDPSIF